jgi:4-amino-4-deoxy-L-arabinose transferase-like glycosyltransferase
MGTMRERASQRGENQVTRLVDRGRPMPERRFWNSEILFVLILLLLCFTLFFFRLDARPLWDIDEGMHAATSKDMVLSGDWITPTLNGQRFYDKPVLHNWLVALSFVVLGFTEFAARLPAAVLGLGCVIVTYLLGRKMFGPTAGFLSGVVLATSVQHIVLSRVVVHDMSLVFFMTLALFFFYMGFKDEKHRKRFLLLFYGSLGFAVLAKGPVGVLLPGLIIGLSLIFERKLGFLKKMEIGWGILVFLIIASPWYIIMTLKHKDYGSYFFIQQNLMYFLSSEPQHPRPIYYYLPVLFGGFLPWSCFLPLAIVRALRGTSKRMRAETVFLLVWFGSILLFFTMASSKLSTYILPLFPAASLLVGLLWHDLLKTPTQTPWKAFLFSFIPLVGILSALTVYIWIDPPKDLAFESGINLIRLNYLVLLMTGMAGLSFWLLLRKHFTGFFWTMVGMVVSIAVFVIVAFVPPLNPYYSTKGLSQRLDLILPPGEKLVCYHRLKDSALFYTNRLVLVLKGRQQLMDYLASDKPVFCIIERRHFERLEKAKKMFYVFERDGNRLIISNRKPS